eukprot:scaffold29394_cov112-Isochrysis_galbana.AAC.2
MSLMVTAWPPAPRVAASLARVPSQTEESESASRPTSGTSADAHVRTAGAATFAVATLLRAGADSESEARVAGELGTRRPKQIERRTPRKRKRTASRCRTGRSTRRKFGSPSQRSNARCGGRSTWTAAISEVLFGTILCALDRRRCERECPAIGGKGICRCIRLKPPRACPECAISVQSPTATRESAQTYSRQMLAECECYIECRKAMRRCDTVSSGSGGPVLAVGRGRRTALRPRHEATSSRSPLVRPTLKARRAAVLEPYSRPTTYARGLKPQLPSQYSLSLVQAHPAHARPGLQSKARVHARVDEAPPLACSQPPLRT